MDHAHPLTHQSRQRRYLLHVPATLRGPAPLVLSFHGGGATAGTALKSSGLRELAATEGFVLACPEGTPRPDGGFTWNAGEVLANAAVRAEVDDVGFTAAVVEDVARQVPIDRTRLYAVGFSAGGMMVHRLGAEAPELFAAIASLAGPLCVDSHPGGFPVPLYYLHGTADPELYYTGGSRIGRAFPSVGHSLGFWLLRNLCVRTPEREHVPPDVHIERWRPAVPSGAEVTLVTIEGGGHTWPGRRWSWYREERDGHLSMTLDATAAVWEFFARHRRAPGL